MPIDPNWTSDDDYETPDWVAKPMADLAFSSSEVSNRPIRIWEPFAGTGQIAKHLIRPGVDLVLSELNSCRYSQLLANCVGARKIIQEDSLSSWHNHRQRGFDLIVTNPPFSFAKEALEICLALLVPSPASRIFFLLPAQFFHTLGIHRWWINQDAHIVREYRIPGRVAYLKNGSPQRGRQVSDSVFEIASGDSLDQENYLVMR